MNMNFSLLLILFLIVIPVISTDINCATIDSQGDCIKCKDGYVLYGKA